VPSGSIRTQINEGIESTNISFTPSEGLSTDFPPYNHRLKFWSVMYNAKIVLDGAGSYSQVFRSVSFTKTVQNRVLVGGSSKPFAAVVWLYQVRFSMSYNMTCLNDTYAQPPWSAAINVSGMLEKFLLPLRLDHHHPPAADLLVAFPPLEK